MKKVLAVVGVLVALTIVNAGIRFAPHSSSKPLDISTLTNDELLAALPDPVGTAPGCPFVGSQAQSVLETIVYFDEKAAEDSARVIGLCVPQTPTGPAQ